MFKAFQGVRGPLAAPKLLKLKIMETTQRRRRKGGFRAFEKPAKTQDTLFAEEKIKAQFYGGFYRKVLQTSENYTDAVIAFCSRIDTVCNRIQYWENVRFAENAKLLKTSALPFYSALDPYWDEYEYMRVDEIKELKRARILTILNNEKKELVHCLRTLVERCTL